MKTERGLPIVPLTSAKPGRFYFLIDKDKASVINELFNFDYFKQICLSNGVQLVKISRPTDKAEINGEIDVEVYVDILCQFWSEKLIEFVQTLQRELGRFELRNQFTPTIQIPSHTVFTKRLSQPHDFNAFACYFGNFLDRGSIIAHWEISHRQEVKPEELPITVEFMHDEGMLYFKFKNMEYERAIDTKQTENWISEKDNNKQKVLVTYTIRLPYKNVKRLFIDLESPIEAAWSETIYSFHFHTLAPVDIFRFTPRNNHLKNQGTRYGDGDRCETVFRGRNAFEHPQENCLSDSPVFSIVLPASELDNKALYSILGRLYHLGGKMPIHFARIDLTLGILAKKSDIKDGEALTYTPHDRADFLRELSQVAHGENNLFRLRYLIEGLLSRGAPAKDRILLSDQTYGMFIRTICNKYLSSSSMVERALEDLLDSIEDLHVNRSILSAFIYLLQHPGERPELTDHLKKDGYMRVRKVVITPSRILYMPADIQMGNRVLREFGDENLDNALRIAFRDDNGGLVRNVNRYDHIPQRIGSVLHQGLRIGGRHFSLLGQSNSQLRDQGCYFIHGTKEDANKIRARLGKFNKISSVPKMVARMGQCFTQSRESEVKLQEGEYLTESDVIGGSNKIQKKDRVSDEPYTFSDGVGRIKKAYLTEVAAKCDHRYHDYTPSCVQFRFRGFKGILTQDPFIDEKVNFLKDVTPGCHESKFSTLKVIFRESQNKFVAPKVMSLEVVKLSGPSGVSLNRPFINILCQVAEAQGKETHQRVQGRIRNLLEKHAFCCAKVLCEEKVARDKLKDLTNRINIDLLSMVSGMHLSSEPFFRSLLKTLVRYSLIRTLAKQQIEIPRNLGRSMFGVMDETGLLQYGQVFIQYTKTMNDRVPTRNAAMHTLTGDVIITKNPSIVAGDVRIFTAVDIPELHHLVDVVVFPQHGPRAHPDEMAGSDLDGDEYSIIWDPELMFDYNEEPMNFPKLEVEQTLNIQPEAFRHKMIDFMIDYLKNDMIGMVSTSHLIQSDHYGLYHIIAGILAEMHSIAVDFPKTGIPPDALDPEWKNIFYQGKDVVRPGTKYTRRPDFLQGDYEPRYRCLRTVGIIFRNIREIQTLLESSMEDDFESPIELDPTFDVPGWEEMKHEAKEDFEEWVHSMKRLMEHYGVSTAAELITGNIIEMRNKALERDGDKTTFFTTNQVIETTVSHLWIIFRKSFFESEKPGHHSFGNYHELTEPFEIPWIDENYPLNRYVVNGNPDMLRKAVAYYRVAYEYASNERVDRSIYTCFPWLVWDVLLILKKERTRKNLSDVFEEVEAKEFPMKLIGYMDAQCHSKKEAMNEFKDKYGVLLDRIKSENIEEAIMDEQQISRSSLTSLISLCFFIAEWVRSSRIQHIRDIHVVIIFIRFATGRIISSQQFCLKKCGGELFIEKAGALILAFLEYLSSRSFISIPSLSFEDFGFDVHMIDGEWHCLHLAARRTFYSICFSGRFDTLIGTFEEDKISTNASQYIHEDSSFITELPSNKDEDLNEICSKLKASLGLVDLLLRRAYKGDPKEFGRVRVTAMGSVDSLRKLRRLLIIDSIREHEFYGKEIEKEYARRIGRRIELLDDPDCNLMDFEDEDY